MINYILIFITYCVAISALYWFVNRTKEMYSITDPNIVALNCTDLAFIDEDNQYFLTTYRFNVNDKKWDKITSIRTNLFNPLENSKIMSVSELFDKYGENLPSMENETSTKWD